jgi:ubiquinone/menaquinone biosynthesis C-methylase UbiE
MHARGTESTEVFQAAIEGREHSVAAWYDYVDRFHTAMPVANETLFSSLRTPGGLSSYGVLARAAAAAGGCSVLDVGCGNGFLMEELIDVFPADAALYGVDMCAAEIAHGRERYARRPQVSLTQARAESLPFEDGAFDVVVSHQLFNFLPDPLPALTEAFRVLRHGGTLAFVTNRWMPKHENTVYQQLYRVALAIAKERYPRLRLPVMEDPRIYTEEGIRELLARAGGVDGERVRFESFSAGAMMTPQAAAAVYSRHYFFASIPSNGAMFDAIEANGRRIAAAGRRDDIDIELPFRLVEARKPLVQAAR